MEHDKHDFPAPDIILATIGRYIHALEVSDFTTAADCFGEDAFYSHPPYNDDSLMPVEVQGRAAIEHLFSSHRGNRNWHHETDAMVIQDDKCFYEGVVRDGPDGPIIMRVVGSGRFEADGRILRWIAYRTGVGDITAQTTLGPL